MSEPKLTARPWQLQDLLDDLQRIIDKQPNGYCNTDRDALCTAKAYLEEHFAEPKWIRVTDRLPQEFMSVLVCMPGESPSSTVREGFVHGNGIWYAAHFDRDPGEVTHWMPLPEPPEEVNHETD